LTKRSKKEGTTPIARLYSSNLEHILVPGDLGNMEDSNQMKRSGPLKHISLFVFWIISRVDMYADTNVSEEQTSSIVRWNMPTILHGIINQKMNINIFTADKT
jgi:hypothetical protein